MGVSYTVSADGQLQKAEVTGQSGDAGFDARVVQQLRTCSFQPARAPASDGTSHGLLLVALGPWPAASQLPSGAGQSPRARDIKRCAATSDDWPAASIRAGEQGTVAMRAWVQADGRLRFIELLGSTSHWRLDQASIHAFGRCSLLPGTDDEGRPRGGFLDVSFSWKLS